MLPSLIERLEKAEEGSRELDADIFWLCEHARAERLFNTAAMGLPKERPATLPIPSGLGRVAVLQYAPHYTTSLTDTLTLIRDGENVTLKRGLKGPYSSALITKNGERAFVAEQCLAFEERPDNELALCLATAAMKLRAAELVSA